MKQYSLILAFSCLMMSFSSSCVASTVPQECGPKPRVLVGSIVRQPPQIVQSFLQSLALLPKQSCQIDYMFIDANEQKESSDILDAFVRGHEGQCSAMDGRETLQKKGKWIWKAAVFKDQILEMAREKEYDYVCLLDSDVSLPSKTIDQLISSQKEIVANIVWSCEPEVPQVWLSDMENQFEIAIQETISDKERENRKKAFLQMLHEPGVYEVGGVAACTLIRRSALLKGVNFHRLSNVTFQSDDCHFCLRAAAIGIPLFVDTHVPAYRITYVTDCEPRVDRMIPFRQESER